MNNKDTVFWHTSHFYYLLAPNCNAVEVDARRVLNDADKEVSQLCNDFLFHHGNTENPVSVLASHLSRDDKYLYRNALSCCLFSFRPRNSFLKRRKRLYMSTLISMAASTAYKLFIENPLRAKSSFNSLTVFSSFPLGLHFLHSSYHKEIHGNW